MSDNYPTLLWAHLADNGEDCIFNRYKYTLGYAGEFGRQQPSDVASS